MVHKREEPEDEEEAEGFTLTEEEQEEGPEPLAALEQDADVGSGAAWSPLFSSSSEHVKNQVGPGAGRACVQQCSSRREHACCHGLQVAEPSVRGYHSNWIATGCMAADDMAIMRCSAALRSACCPCPRLCAGEHVAGDMGALSTNEVSQPLLHHTASMLRLLCHHRR